MSELIAASRIAAWSVLAAWARSRARRSASKDSFGRVSVTLAGAEAADVARALQAAFTLATEADASA
eukprot:117531-Pleurochrysis_carterae.AAC.1